MSIRKQPDYITMRMDQLMEERDNPNNNQYDSLWYNRLIQELDWCQQALGNSKQRNCFMENSNRFSQQGAKTARMPKAVLK